MSASPAGGATEHLAAVVREEWGRMIALLIAQYRRVDLVEDALADAVESAARHWPRSGVPDVPVAWLLTAARRRVLDRLRAEAMAARTHPALVTQQRRVDTAVRADPGNLVEDDLLRLVLMCTHPALDPSAASALSLRLVLGVSTADIAHLFLVPSPTMAARLTRAKRKITSAGIPFAVPTAEVLPQRLATVAQTAYLAFTAGYAPGSGPDAVRVHLAGEAIRLVRVIAAMLPPDPTLTALTALMLLQHSRRDARVDAAGAIVLLPDQDRRLWHREEVDEAARLMSSPILTGPIPVQAAAYLVQARIAAEHATAGTAQQTRWDRIVRHYDDLVALQPGPAAMLGRVVAVAEAEGAAAGLAAMGSVPDDGTHRHAAVHADLLFRAGHLDAAAARYRLAIERCSNGAEAQLLSQRLAEVVSSG